MPWMIRDSSNGKFSNGILWPSGYGGNPVLGWGKRGKVWTDVKLLKAHILKYAQMSPNGECPATWEVLEIIETAKPINEWIDAEMVMKLLKKTK